MHLPWKPVLKSAIGANSFKCIGSGLRCRKLCAEDRYIGEFTAAVEGFRTYCHYIRSDFHCCQLLRSGHCRGANGCYTKALSTNLYCRRDRKGLSCCLVRSSGKDYGSLAGCVCTGYLIFQPADCIDRVFLNRDPEFFCNRTVIFSFSFDSNGCSSDIFIILPGKGVIPSVYKLLTAIGYGECLGQWLSGKGPGLKCGYLCFADIGNRCSLSTNGNNFTSLKIHDINFTLMHSLYISFRCRACITFYCKTTGNNFLCTISHVITIPNASSPISVTDFGIRIFFSLRQS